VSEQMSTPDPLDDFIDVAARLLGLPLEPAWRPAVRANLEITLRLGAQVEAFDLPDEAEPAPVFAA
jgi:1-carboxybiuret hydrolase subunit AtzG-like protein